MRKLIFTLILFFAQFSLATPIVNDCRRFFNYPDGTDAFISYLESISQLPSVASQLLSFYQRIAHGELLCPISNESARVNAELQIHRSGINRILEQSAFNVSKLSTWATERVAQLSKNGLERANIELQTETAAIPFQMVPITSTQPHLMLMNGPVTQMMWAQVFKRIPPTVKDPQMLLMKVGQQEIEMLPDHPITGVTFWSAVVFANEMSKQLGLPEAYDLTGITFKQEANNPNTPEQILRLAARGALSIFDSNNVYEFIKNNPMNSQQRPGLRLPTEDEFEILIYKLAQYRGVTVEQLSDQQIEEIFGGSKAEQLHAIRSEFEPATVDSNLIADLLGHISFLTNGIAVTYPGGTPRWELRTMGTSSHRKKSVKDKKSNLISVNGVGGYTGFTLVRTVQP